MFGVGEKCGPDGRREGEVGVRAFAVADSDRAILEDCYFDARALACAVAGFAPGTRHMLSHPCAPSSHMVSTALVISRADSRVLSAVADRCSMREVYCRTLSFSST